MGCGSIFGIRIIGDFSVYVLYQCSTRRCTSSISHLKEIKQFHQAQKFTVCRSESSLRLWRLKRITAMNWIFYFIALLGKRSLPPYPIATLPTNTSIPTPISALHPPFPIISLMALKCLIVHISYLKMMWLCTRRTSCCKRWRSCLRIRDQFLPKG
jgi:hypothetical protein